MLREFTSTIKINIDRDIHLLEQQIQLEYISKEEVIECLEILDRLRSLLRLLLLSILFSDTLQVDKQGE